MTVQDIKALLGNLIEYFTDDESAKDVGKVSIPNLTVR